MALQSYTLAQLRQLQLLAFRKDWEDAFCYIGFSIEDSIFFARSINNLGILKFTLEYFSLPEDLIGFDDAVQYLMNKFDLK